VVCNSGVSLTPVIDGQVHHFECRGIYNGLSLLWDKESGSFWDHVTGEAVQGPLKGEKLPVFNLLQMSVEAALADDPELEIAISTRDIETNIWSPYLEESADLPVTYIPSMAEDDPRRPMMDIGLGVWTDDVQRYYPLEVLRQRNGVIIDRLGGKAFLIYIDALSGTPVALPTSAKKAEWRGADLLLDSGEMIRQGVLVDENGRKKSVKKPMQVFTRWYGFAYTFPDCEVFGL